MAVVINAPPAIFKAVQGAGGIAGLSRKEWPRAAWLETRQALHTGPLMADC
jgi:hypothetical protein